MAEFDQKYRSEWYASLAQTPEFNLDAPILWDAYTQARSLRPRDRSKSHADDVYHIVDVGTGTGRVIRNLSDSLIREGLDLEDAQFTGVDINPHDIEWAKGTIPEPLAQRISYVVGSAVALREVIPLKEPSVDLLIFSAGGVSLLYEPSDAIERFLGEVAALLRPDTGRAYISVLNAFIAPDAGQATEKVEQLLGTSTAPEGTSSLYPNVVYRHRNTGVTREGNVLFMNGCLEVLVRDSNGRNEVTAKDASSEGSRILRDGELLSLARAVGLESVDVIHTALESIFVLKVSS